MAVASALSRFINFKRGRVVEEVAHDDARAFGAARILDRAGDAALQVELCSAERAALARENVEPRNGRDRRERLAAKAQRADGGQILRRAQLARRVAQKSRRQLAWRDAAAVIADAKIGHAAVFHLHRHALRAGVNGVFQQLLDNARRALDHLARGDEVGDMRR